MCLTCVLFDIECCCGVTLLKYADDVEKKNIWKVVSEITQWIKDLHFYKVNTVGSEKSYGCDCLLSWVPLAQEYKLFILKVYCVNWWG